MSVVVPPWNFPLAIPAGGVLAALAAGNAVILKPAPETVRDGVAARRLPAGTRACRATCCSSLPCPDDDVGRALITHPDVGARDPHRRDRDRAAVPRRGSPSMRLHAETSGKNAIVVTAAADLDLAVRDLVRSAFGHAGQKCSAASLAIVEQSVLDDAAVPARSSPTRPARCASGRPTSLAHRRRPADPPAGGTAAPRAARRSTRASRGWSSRVSSTTPGTTGRPGIRVGVAPGSWFHRTECFGPVLGVMRARDLDHAIELQNATDFGLTGGHPQPRPRPRSTGGSTAVEVGNAYVNRHITGAIVQRQPFGGWKASTVGPTVKAGGPSYVLSLGRWSGGRGAGDDFDDRWRDHFSVEHDPSALVAERNVLRYRPIPLVAVRYGAGATERDRALIRRAAAVTGAGLVQSSAADERADVFAARIAGLGADRLRLVGDVEPAVLLAARTAAVDVDDAPVVAHGRIELLRWMREQSISETMHRYGNVRR